MSLDVLLGLQWGDEGKGKVVDYLSKQYDLVARFQGGPNAGHTLEFDNKKHVLHQIPSGIFSNNSLNIIGNGVVLDPVIFKNEIEKIELKFGLTLFDNLFISNKVQLITPSHRFIDKILEKEKGDKKIGSTLRGIGPTYQDKIGRHGLRVGDIKYDNFKNKYERQKEMHSYLFKDINLEEFNSEEKQFFDSINFLKKFNLTDTEYLINKNLNKGKSVLAEGAQGTLLDIDFGSYPFVTSSNTTTAGACIGLGVSPKKVDKVYGVFKAYCTRVGKGPFPTELFDKEGEEIAKKGNEFGSTTGRARRCGWLDLLALKYAVMLNGVTELFMMKADVLSGFDKVFLCTKYLFEGKEIDYFPSTIGDSTIEPIYESFDGWKNDISECKEKSDFPVELINYIQFIENNLKIPIKLVSVGPDRNQTVLV